MRNSYNPGQLSRDLGICKLAGQCLFIIFVILTSSTIAFSTDNKYIGSKESNKYHYKTCRWVKNIKKENIVEFKTVKEAVDAGYEPCGTCKPRTQRTEKKNKK